MKEPFLEGLERLGLQIARTGDTTHLPEWAAGLQALAWAVKYQGSRKVKATPFFQVDRDDRHAHPLRLQIKCASAQRIAPLLADQPDWLRADFIQRTFPCKDCDWCRNKKTLGPYTLDLDGKTRTICWYTNPDLRAVDERTVPLVRQYEKMHALLGEN